jgi:hypothetical protein
MTATMINTIKAALAAAGCTYVLYESEQQANNQLDITSPEHVIGLLLESNTMTLRTGGNTVRRAYPLTFVQVLQQVPAEASADSNQARLDRCAFVAGAFVNALIAGGQFRKIPNVTASKVNESRYDANCIGWQLALDLQLIDAAQTCE